MRRGGNACRSLYPLLAQYAERLVQGIETEYCVQGVGKLPSEYIAAVPIDDSDQVDEAAQARDFATLWALARAYPTAVMWIPSAEELFPPDPTATTQAPQVLQSAWAHANQTIVAQNAANATA